MSRSSSSSLRRLFFAALCVLLVALPASSQERNWRIQDFHSDITLHKNGSAEVVEALTMLFNGEYHGIDRMIPTEYPGANGANYSLDLSVKRVADDAGNRLRYQTSRMGKYERLRIYIPGAIDATKKVFITYTVGDPVRFGQKDYDEFYWNITGNGWRVPIDAASALIHLPPSATGIRAQAFTGAYGEKGQDAAVNITRTDVSVISNNPLSAQEGLTIDIAVPKGVFSEPGPVERALQFIAANSIVLLPIWTFLVMFAVKWHWGRSEDAGESVAPQYEPPRDLPPAECGTLIDDKTDPRDITCVIIDLAVRGYIKIREMDVKHLLHTTKDYELTLLKQPGDDLAPYERVMLDNIFADGSTINVSDLRDRFYVVIPTIRSQIMSELDRKGMYAVDPSQGFGYVFLGAIISATPFLIALYFFNAQFFNAGWWAFASIFVAVVIVLIFGSHMSATTLKGSRARVWIQGFREFMQRVDQDRLKRMPADTFERYLAYAMALGVEEHWAKAFTGIIQSPPSWYQGNYYPGMMWSPWLFTQSLGTMTQTTGDAFVATPTPSATSTGFGSGGFGSGGGGFSGGGFGGGGGDAF